MKQRIFAALLALVMTLSLCACGGQVQPDPTKGKLPNGESGGSGESGAYDDSLDLLRQEMEGIQPYLFAAAWIGDGAGPLESDVREWAEGLSHIIVTPTQIIEKGTLFLLTNIIRSIILNDN